MSNLFAQPFMQHALLAGTFIALASGVVGWFLVLRTQVFSSDALGHVAYTGALGALAFSVSPQAGLLIATVVTAVAIASLGSTRADDVVIGSTFAWILGLGSFFLMLYTTRKSGGNSTANVTYLFGSIFGISFSQALVAACVGLGVCLAMALIARPLLFASIDEAVAAARGVPVRVLGIVFLALVGIVCAEAVQAVGGLLFLGLVAAPAGAAHRLTTRPIAGVLLCAGIAVASMWAGLTFSYYVPGTPPSFAIITAAALAYLAAAYRPSSTASRPSSTASRPSSEGFWLLRRHDRQPKLFTRRGDTGPSEAHIPS